MIPIKYKNQYWINIAIFRAPEDGYYGLLFSSGDIREIYFCRGDLAYGLGANQITVGPIDPNLENV